MNLNDRLIKKQTLRTEKMKKKHTVAALALLLLGMPDSMDAFPVSTIGYGYHNHNMFPQKVYFDRFPATSLLDASLLDWLASPYERYRHIEQRDNRFAQQQRLAREIFSSLNSVSHHIWKESTADGDDVCKGEGLTPRTKLIDIPKTVWGTIEVDMPGVSDDAVSVILIPIAKDGSWDEGSRLLVQGKASVATSKADSGKKQGDTSTRCYSAEYLLGKDIDAESVEANFNYGLLTVALKQHEPAQQEQSEKLQDSEDATASNTSISSSTEASQNRELTQEHHSVSPEENSDGDKNIEAVTNNLDPSGPGQNYPDFGNDDRVVPQPAGMPPLVAPSSVETIEEINLDTTDNNNAEAIPFLKAEKQKHTMHGVVNQVMTEKNEIQVRKLI